MKHEHGIVYLGELAKTELRESFGILEKDRLSQIVITGNGGTGKSVLIENLAIQDFNNHEGVCVIDPYGSLIKKLLDSVPEHRVKDLVYLDMSEFAEVETQALPESLSHRVDFQDVLNHKKIVLVNLAIGTVGELKAREFGIALIKQMYAAGDSRALLAANRGTNLSSFYLYIDEIARFDDGSTQTALAEFKTLGISTTVSCEYLGALSDGMKNILFHEFKTLVVFRSSVSDAEFLANELGYPVTSSDIMNLENYCIYVRPLIYEKITEPYLLKALPSNEA